MRTRTRRDVVKELGLLLGAAAAGCGRSGTLGSIGSSSPPLPHGDPGPGPQPTPTPPNLTPEELLAGIDTFVVLYMENHSFDTMLGSLKLEEGRAVEGLSGTEWNPDPAGNAV